MRSWDDCYRRKVRCDSLSKEPCSACKRSRVECGKFTFVQSVSLENNVPVLLFMPQVTNQPVNRFTRQWKQAVRSRRGQTTNRTSERDEYVDETGPSNASPSNGLQSNASFSHNLRAGHSESTIQGQPSVVGSDVIISQGLVRSGLSQFLSIGVTYSSWDVFDKPEQVRIAYIGTELSNFTHLISLELN
jgi:hypothetical protein